MCDKAVQSRALSQDLLKKYSSQQADWKRQVNAKATQTKLATKRLEARRKELLRPGGDAHEHANYLVGLHILQNSGN